MKELFLLNHHCSLICGCPSLLIFSWPAFKAINSFARSFIHRRRLHRQQATDDNLLMVNIVKNKHRRTATEPDSIYAHAALVVVFSFIFSFFLALAVAVTVVAVVVTYVC